uniref:EGF-like domain-containing protein n=1 Tax=Leptobrachium leishanense TaxID=445787 RepID=A0A8C5PRQ7_9ANUR
MLLQLLLLAGIAACFGQNSTDIMNTNFPHCVRWKAYTATLAVKASPQAMFANCPDTHSEFCYHGTCRFLVSEWEPSCICFSGYFGSRCQYIDFLQVMAVDPRTFAVVALMVTFLVLLTVTSSTCFGIYLYRKRKKNRKGRLQTTNAPVPPEDINCEASRRLCPSNVHQPVLEEVSTT